MADEDATNVKSMEQIARERPPKPSRPAARAAPASRAPAARSAAPAPARREPVAPATPDLDSDPWENKERSPHNPIEDPEVMLQDAGAFLRTLQGSDRIAFWGAVVVALSCFLPWKETAADGDVLGLMSAGVGAFLLSVGAMVAISIRVRRSMPGLNPMLPWLAQLGMTLVCLVWCAVYIKTASDMTRVPTPIGNADMMNSSPSMGAFLGVLGALAALGGTLLGLKDKPAE